MGLADALWGTSGGFDFKGQGLRRVDVSMQEAAYGRMEALRIAFENAHEPVLRQAYFCSIFVGIAMFPSHGQTADDLIVDADKALYDQRVLVAIVFAWPNAQQHQTLTAQVFQQLTPNSLQFHVERNPGKTLPCS